MRTTVIASLSILPHLAACSPVVGDGSNGGEILCAPRAETSPVLLDMSPYWNEPPAALAPNESFVEAQFVATRVVALRRPGAELDDERRERACTCVEPAAFHQFHIMRVISGAFGGSAFEWLQQGGGCGSTSLDPRFLFRRSMIALRIS